MTPTRPNIPELRHTLEQSTQGEWYAKVQSINQGEYDEDHMTLDIADVDRMVFYRHEPDAPFIARAHNDMPALLSYIEHLESLCARAAGECQRLRMNCLSVGVIPLNGMQFDSIIDELRAVAGTAKGEGE